MSAASISLDEAVDLARTGDVWLFRGHKMADRAIQVATNSPVNHVGMCVAIDDLPPLMWHAELGRSLPDVWTGDRHRGVQLHDLRESVIVWAARYGQRAWLRQLDPVVTGEMEDAVLRTIARLSGTPFPSTASLASRWLLGRLPARGQRDGAADLETAYCAQVLAVTYQAMGLLPAGRRDRCRPDARGRSRNAAARRRAPPSRSCPRRLRHSRPPRRSRSRSAWPSGLCGGVPRGLGRFGGFGQPGVQPVTDFVGGVGAAAPLVADDHHASGGHAREGGES